MAAIFLAGWLGPVAAVIGAVVTAAMLVFWWRGAHGAQDCVLRVERGELLVRSRKSTKVRALLRLDDLVDVVLESKQVRRLQDGANPIPALRFVESQVAPEVDISRVVLIASDGTSIALSEMYLANMDATEWLWRVRVFLRRHGWLPDDERDEAMPLAARTPR